jgi:TetR/AcrR family transcriptional regulator, transcriptional repressor for nem operon
MDGPMAKHTHRDKILESGLRVVHERGFAGASVRDIVRAAGVPQGSFSNHFASKEAFGVEILNLYFEQTLEIIQKTLHNDQLAPLERIRAYIEGVDTSLIKKNELNGCLMGNFSLESGEQSPMIQRRLVELFAEVQKEIANCVRDAVKAKELPSSTNARDFATFLHASLEGALLQSRAEQSRVAMDRYKRVLYSTILR